MKFCEELVFVVSLYHTYLRDDLFPNWIINDIILSSKFRSFFCLNKESAIRTHFNIRLQLITSFQIHVAQNRRGYSKRQMQSALLVVAIVSVFAITTLPVMSVGMLIWLGVIDSIPLLLAIIFHIMLYSNSAINPFLYGLFNSSFRFYKMIRKLGHYNFTLLSFKFNKTIFEPI